MKKKASEYESEKQAETSKEDPASTGVWLQEATWQDICGRGRLQCRYCGEEPLIEDVEVFADEGLCGTCAAAERRWAQD